MVFPNTSYVPLKDGFYSFLKRQLNSCVWRKIYNSDEYDVIRAIDALRLSESDFSALLSPAAIPYLEKIAHRARNETINHFGYTIQLFTPLYLANYCTNKCVYCGFNAERKIDRNMLNIDQVEREAKSIAGTGLRNILALTGDAVGKTGISYLTSCVEVLSGYFSSVGIEVPSMTESEYAEAISAGTYSMTIFQETYNERLYEDLHPAGPKRNFVFRLDAPQRAVKAGMRAVNLGSLLGLDDWRRDIFFTGLHASFLQQCYPELEISISLPRLRPYEENSSGHWHKFYPQTVTDKDFVQALLAIRCFMPQVGITLSTREPAWLRDKLITIGVTKMSAGVSTSVGGYSDSDTENKKRKSSQFEISDQRSVDEIVNVLKSMGYQAIYSDWQLPGNSNMYGKYGQKAVI